MNKYIGFLFSFFVIHSLNAQINIKIGYNAGFASADVNNNILEEFNEIKRGELSDSLSIPFKGLNFMHGLDLGIRFKFTKSSAFELGWQNLSRSREAVGEINEVSLFQQELFYSFNQFYASYQSNFNGYGMGVGLGYNTVKIQDRIASSDFKETVIREGQLFAKINLSFYFKSSSSVSFAIQPYYQFSLADINLQPLQSELGLTQSNDSNESFNIFGISFVFYNGRQ